MTSEVTKEKNRQLPLIRDQAFEFTPKGSRTAFDDSFQIQAFWGGMLTDSLNMSELNNRQAE